MREADDAPAGNVIEFDVIADLRRALEKGIGGGGGGNGNGGGGGGGDGDPYNAPVTVRMLLDAAKQIAEHVAQIGGMNLKASEALSDATIGAIRNQNEAMEAITKQLHANAMSISDAIATRLEAVEERVLAIEKHLGGKPAPRASGAVEDAGGGP